MKQKPIKSLSWWRAFQEDSAQKLRFRRMGLALIGALTLTVAWVVFYHEHVFRVTYLQLVYFSLIFWLVNACFVFVLVSGLNKRFFDPSLTTIQMIWSVSAIMIAVYFSNEQREALLMLTFLVIIFGGFHYSKARVYGMVFYSLILYLFVICFLKDFHVVPINIAQEMVVFFIYAIVLFGCNILVLEVISAKKALKDKSELLKGNLQKIEIESITDPLTGIGNRRYLQKILKSQMSMVERSDQYFFSISMIDIDHFKDVNDKFGHDMGDKVLQKLCGILNYALRESDTFGRFGGEEFIVISPLTHAKQTVEFAERMRILVQNTIFDKKLNLYITISIGVTVYKDSEALDTILKRVDEALYEAKNKGRNQVVIL